MTWSRDSWSICLCSLTLTFAIHWHFCQSLETNIVPYFERSNIHFLNYPPKCFIQKHATFAYLYRNCFFLNIKDNLHHLNGWRINPNKRAVQIVFNLVAQNLLVYSSNTFVQLELFRDFYSFCHNFIATSQLNYLQ